MTVTSIIVHKCIVLEKNPSMFMCHYVPSIYINSFNHQNSTLTLPLHRLHLTHKGTEERELKSLALDHIGLKFR